MGVLAALPILAGPEVTPRDIQRAGALCQQAAKALNAGDITKADDLYKKALAVVPSHPEARIGAGHILMRQGRFEEALSEYERGRAAFASLGEALLDLRLKRYSETQRQIVSLRDQLRTLQGALANSQTGMGTTRANPGTLERDAIAVEDAIRNLEAIQAPSPEQPREPPGEVDFFIGNAQFRLDRLDEAVRSWESCAAKSPKFALVRNNLAVAYWKKGRIEDARKTLARAEELGMTVNPQLKADLDKAAAQTPSPAATVNR